MQKFTAGEEVWYRNKKAEVVSYVGGDERRYYVDIRCSGRWSAPEILLFKSNTGGSRTPQIRYGPPKTSS